jgi:hydrogenase maturation protein HypF
VPDVLVMTSGNLTDEPIAFVDSDARDRLRAVADAWLVHDRPIHVPCDDSVVRVVDESGTRVELPIRRSRGYAPLPLTLPFSAPPVLAVGAELKNTFCLAAGRHAWMSQHIGDMGSVETLDAFERSTGQFAVMYDVVAPALAADAHPGYHTRQWAESHADRADVALVQHHHAHVASLMAEHSVASGERILGFAFDGTGYGTDGAIWGGEALLAGYDAYERVAHLRYVPLPGGDAAIRKPSRVALAHLHAAGIAWDPDLPPVGATAPAELDTLRRQLSSGLLCTPTSSMGRLFDAVSSLIGVRHTASYEAEAAIELEALAERGTERARAYAFGVDGPCIDATCIDPGPVLREIVADLRARRDESAIAAGFHAAVADAVVTVARVTRERCRVERVGLTGGVFQNALLLRLTRQRLVANGFDVLTHRIVPPNDGGLALGQVLVAAHADRIVAERVEAAQ